MLKFLPDVSGLSDHAHAHAFKGFKAEHHRNYKNEQEHTLRFKHFVKNRKSILAINA